MDGRDRDLDDGGICARLTSSIAWSLQVRSAVVLSRAAAQGKMADSTKDDSKGAAAFF